jgi:NAD(P)-dependent dehydrogenase (short-subunit alcohol dehydrogenase family)
LTTTPLPLAGRVAVVTGGTSGIGLALIRGLAEAGADVVPVSRKREQVDAAAAEVESRGRRAVRVSADVNDRASLESAVQQILAELDHIDILVNCAGITKRTPTLHVTDEEWRSIIDTNLTGSWRACQVFGKPMVARGYGRIINIASLASFVGLFEVAAYTASKAGVAGLTRALAVEWGRHGVNVNAIAPGVYRTSLNAALLDGTERGKEFKLRTPLGRFGRVEELSGACVFLASEAASFINGEILTVDGGFLASGVNQ